MNSASIVPDIAQRIMGGGGFQQGKGGQWVDHLVDQAWELDGNRIRHLRQILTLLPSDPA